MDKQEIINEILDNFDFEWVRVYMVDKDWIWDSCDGVPSIDDLERCASQMLYRVLDEDLDFSYTGGFCAAKRCGQLSLAFQIEEFSVDLDDDDDDGDTAPSHGFYSTERKLYSEPPKTTPRPSKCLSLPNSRLTVDPDGTFIVEIATNPSFSQYKRYYLLEVDG